MKHTDDTSSDSTAHFNNDSERHPNMKGVWLFAVTALVATATIAAIRLNPDSEKTQTTLSTPRSKTLNSTPASTNSTGSWSPANKAIGPWNEIRIRRGDTFGHILDSRGLYHSVIRNLIDSNDDASTLADLKPGRSLRYRLAANGKELHELIYNKTATESVRLYKSEKGDYTIALKIRDIQTRHAFVTGNIDSSLFIAGQEAGLSDPLIMRLTEIFGWDIDFATSLRRGDTFSVIHEEKFWLGQKIADGPILAAEFVNRGKTFRAIGLRNHQNRLEYYTPEHRSVKRPFLRTPVQFSRISSRFGKRKHPILKRWRSHNGIDYASPRGTPIRSTGSGRVTFRGRKGGYGNTIVLQHGYKLSTLYAHMKKFRSGIRLGSYVEQGQIIGYVGSSGLATGPHLHYELRRNGHHRNPLTYPLPKATIMAKEDKPQFQKILLSWAPRLDLMGRNRIKLARTK